MRSRISSLDIPTAVPREIVLPGRFPPRRKGEILPGFSGRGGNIFRRSHEGVQH